MAVVVIILSAVLTALTAIAFGSFATRRLPLTRAEKPAVAFIVGAGILSLVVFVLCATHLYYRGVILAISIAAVLASLVGRTPWSAGGPPGPPPPPQPEDEVLARAPGRGPGGPPDVFFRPTVAWDKLERLMFLAFLPFVILYLSNALAPETSPDGSSYHLGIIAHYIRNHGFVPLHTTMYASLSQGVELVYMVAFTFGRHSAAALMHLLFFTSAAWLMICFGRRTGQTKPAIAAAFLFYASPIAGVDGSSAYIDCATAAILFTIFYLLFLYRTVEQTNVILLLTGFLCGYAFGAKYTAGAMIIYALLTVRKPRPAMLVLAASLILGTPWLLKNFNYTGNPLAPFFNRVFPNPFQHVQWEEDYKAYFKTYDIPKLTMIPGDLTVKGQYLGGLLGPVFLLLPLALLGLRRKEVRQLWLAGLICCIPYPLNIGTRFLILALPFFSLALAETIAQANTRILLPTLMLAHGLLSWPRTPPGLLSTYAGATWRIVHAPFQQAFRIEPEDRYLSRTQPGYLKARLIDKLVPPGEIVFTMGTVSDSYTSHEVAVFFQSAFGENLGDLIFTGQKPDRQGIRLLRFKIATPQTLRKIRVEQTEIVGPAEQWAISELRFFHQSLEVARDPKWLLTARPNWWEVQAAFDGSPVTRWRTQQRSQPGDYVEVDFSAPRAVDRVDLTTSPDHWKTRVRVMGLIDGAWKPLADKPEEIQLPEWRFARRMATLEIAARGVHYMMVDSGDYGARDIIDDPGFWGLEELGQTGEAHLYHIKPK